MYNSIKQEIRHIDEELDVLEADWKVAEHKLLEFYVKVVPKLIKAESCSIFIAEHEGDGAWLRAGTGLNERSMTESRVTHLFVGEAIQTGKTIYKDNLGESAQQGVDASADLVAKDVLCMPIRSIDGTHVTGAIQILNREGGAPYSEEDLALLNELLHYLELSVENVYFQQEARGVIQNAWQMLTKITAGATIGFFVLISAFSLYWFGFYLLGSS